MVWPFDPLRMFGYDVAMIDCPWPFDLYSNKGNAKSPAAQYDVMTLDEIAALPVGQLLRAGGVAWVWFTWPLLRAVPQMVEESWGLKVVTGGAWAKRTVNGKLRIGTGYVARSVCEPFALCAAGGSIRFENPIARNMIETFADVGLDGLAREHSRKPDEAYAAIEAAAPHAFRADVFSRSNRPGWDCWGRETGKFDMERAS